MHAVPLKNKKFEQKDLDLSLKYFDPEVCWPEYYDNNVLSKTFPGLVYKKRIIMNIDDIVRLADKETLDSFIDESDKTMMRDYADSLLEHIQQW